MGASPSVTIRLVVLMTRVCRATREQLDEFVDLCTPLPGPASVDWHSSDSLFIFAFGINDMVSAYCICLVHG